MKLDFGQINQLKSYKDQMVEKISLGYKDEIKSKDKLLVDKVKTKSKLKIDEQIRYLNFKGIQFKNIDEKSAQSILSKNTYYYKITSFRKNFEKDSNGKYVNLDFGHLSDLATIDMHFRYLVMKLTLDIEHSIKSNLINAITEGDEDGYSIIVDYDLYQKNLIKQKIIKDGSKTEDVKKQECLDLEERYIAVDKKIMDNSNSKSYYHEDLYQKRGSSPSIWVLIELMTFGQLAQFLKFYTEEKKHNSKSFKNTSEFLYFAKNIRDIAAHSRPILFNIVEVNQFHSELKGGQVYSYNSSKKRNPKLSLKNYAISSGVNRQDAALYLTNFKIHDIISVLYLHHHLIKGSMRAERLKEMTSFCNRCKRNAVTYELHFELKKIFKIYEQVIDYYGKEC